MNQPEFFQQINLEEHLRKNEGMSGISLEYFLRLRISSYQHMLQVWQEIGNALSAKEENLTEVDLIFDRFVVYILSGSLGYLSKSWPVVRKGKINTDRLVKSLSSRLIRHYSISERTVSLIKSMVQLKVQNPNMQFEEALLSVFPRDELPMILTMENGEINHQPALTRCDFFSIFLNMFARTNDEPVVIQEDKRRKIYWVHIKRVSFDPKVQAVATFRNFKQALNSQELKNGWSIVGVSHLLGERADVFINVLSRRFGVKTENIQRIEGIDAAAVGRGETELLPNFVSQKMIVKTAFKNLHQSSTYAGQFIINGQLPKIGILQFPIGEITT